MPSPTTPGIYLRGGAKAYFADDNAIKEREIVMATDTGELGTIDGWFDPFNIPTGGRIGVIEKQFDSDTRTFGASWADGKIWNSVSLAGGSRIRLDWRVPMRNDAGGWGGGYIDIQYSFNSGTTWSSIGSSGYDGPMASGGDIITSMSGSFIFTDCPSGDFDLSLKFRHRSYDGTLTINGNHSIETGEFGAFWSNIMLTEILA